jgi:hypothetical protein
MALLENCTILIANFMHFTLSLSSSLETAVGHLLIQPWSDGMNVGCRGALSVGGVLFKTLTVFFCGWCAV